MKRICVRGVVALTFSFLLWTPFVAGQPNTCGGLSSVDDSSAKLIYPPIAKAAHVSGVVLLLVTFQQDGTVQDAQSVSGPMLLRKSAVEFARAWKVNTYTGPRTCPIAIRYILDVVDGEPRPGTTDRVDPQHVTVRGGVPLTMYSQAIASTDPQHWQVHGDTPCLCDPAGEIHRKQRFGIF